MTIDEVLLYISFDCNPNKCIDNLLLKGIVFACSNYYNTKADVPYNQTEFVSSVDFKMCQNCNQYSQARKRALSRCRLTTYNDIKNTSSKQFQHAACCQATNFYSCRGVINSALTLMLSLQITKESRRLHLNHVRLYNK